MIFPLGSWDGAAQTRRAWWLAVLVAWASPLLAQIPTAGAEVVADGPALLRQWTPPSYPGEVLKEGVRGVVMVRFVVDETGKVTSARVLESPDARLNAAALAAVQSWSFSPALDSGRAVPCGLDVPVRFDAVEAKKKLKPKLMPPESEFPQLSPHTETEPKSTPPGLFPPLLEQRKISGVVRFVGTVTREGRVINPRVTAATHPDFVVPALESLTRWEFTPAKQGDLAVAAEVRGDVSFDSHANDRGEIFEANGLSALDGSPSPFTPDILGLVEPVPPFKELLKGEGGWVTAEFVVDETGLVRDVVIKEVSHPDFEHAVRSALRGWVFGRTVNGGRAMTVPLRLRVAFPAVPTDTGATLENDPVARLTVAWRAGQIGTAKGLDEKLRPLYRVPPEYPPELRERGSPSGQVDVEFVIDREGRARLPHVIQAAYEEMGWAAVTAVSQWVFTPPMRGGQPVDIRVRIPFDFKPE